MNLEDMSREELIEAAKKAGGETPAASDRYKTVEVDGLEVTVDMDKVRSWNMFKLVSQLDGELDARTVGLMFDIIKLATDVDEDAIVDHCGGDAASMEDVVRTASLIIAELYPKN